MIPPAWKDVWVTPYENGHLQAVGTDEAGRRQYLYHPDWRSRRDAEKFDRVLQFGKALSKARERVLTDLGTEGMELTRACAVAVRLLDLGYFRIGNDVYSDKYGSFGLTTLERRHVRKHGDQLVFEFTGKSGIEHHVEIDDPAAVEALEAMRRRRGEDERLLAFKEGRSWQPLDAARVNDYVRETTGLDATAKDFRTWHATVIAAAELAETDEPGESKASRKRAISGSDEGGRRVPREHAHPRPLGVRRSPCHRRLRAGQHDRHHHPAPLREGRRPSGRPGARRPEAPAIVHDVLVGRSPVW